MSNKQHEYTWQDLEAAIGQDFSGGVTRTGADPAERGAIRRFCEALEMDCPLFFDEEVAHKYGHAGIPAPVSMINSTLTAPAIWKPGDQTRWPSPERNAVTDTLQTGGGRPMPIPPTSAGFATDIEIEYFSPVYVGDRLTASGQKLVSVNIRETSVGQGAFFVTEGEIRNQIGDLVARTRNGLYRYNPHPEGTFPSRRPDPQPSPTQAEPGTAPPAQASSVNWSVQRYYEDVQEGDSVPPVVTNITVQRLVIEAGANRDFTPIHHNSQIAQSQAAPEMYANNIFIQGMWERAVREFIGLAGTIRKVGPFRMRIFNTVGESVVTKGTVRRRWREDGENFLELEMLSEHSRGVSVGQGPVVVTLPSRSG